MTNPGRPPEYPFRAPELAIDQAMRDFIDTEASARTALAPLRRKPSVLRDALRFCIAHHDLFLAWVSTHGEIAIRR